jgi:hypothetical protein
MLLGRHVSTTAEEDYMANFKDPRDEPAHLRGVADLLTDASDADIVREFADELERALLYPPGHHDSDDDLVPDRGSQQRGTRPSHAVLAGTPLYLTNR